MWAAQAKQCWGAGAGVQQMRCSSAPVCYKRTSITTACAASLSACSASAAPRLQHPSLMARHGGTLRTLSALHEGCLQGWTALQRLSLMPAVNASGGDGEAFDLATNQLPSLPPLLQIACAPPPLHSFQRPAPPALECITLRSSQNFILGGTGGRQAARQLAPAERARSASSIARPRREGGSRSGVG